MYPPNKQFYFIIKIIMKKTLLFVFASVLVFGVFAFAEETSTGAWSTWGATVTATTTPTDAIVCVKAALEKRESAIKWAMDAYYASWGTAFTARTMAFTDALFQPNRQEVKKASDAARKIYKTAMNTAKKAKKGIIQTSWNTFRVEVKACKGDLPNVLKYENGKSDLTD